MIRESGYYWVCLYEGAELEVMKWCRTFSMWLSANYDYTLNDSDLHYINETRIEPPRPITDPVTLGDVAKREALHRRVFGVVLSRDDLELKGYTQVREGRVLRIKRNDVVLGEVML